MNKKNLLFFLLLLSIMTGGVSCLGKGESESKSSATSLAVIDSRPEMGGCVMNLPEAVVATPELANNLKEGDCILVNFTINYSKQPSTDYYTATEIKYQLLNNTPVEVRGGEMIDDYNDPLSYIFLISRPNFKGNLFAQIEHEEKDSQLYDYELIFNPDSVDEKGIHTVFLKSRKLNKVGTQNAYESFNLHPLFEAYGKDTLYQSGSIKQEYRYVSLNFKYQSGVEEGLPVYSLLEREPVNIYIYK
jgi:hypothetical protein